MFNVLECPHFKQETEEKKIISNVGLPAMANISNHGFLQGIGPIEIKHPRARILVQVTIYRRLLIGRDGYLDQSEAYDIS